MFYSLSLNRLNSSILSAVITDGLGRYSVIGCKLPVHE